jgi:CubicO group peptidase (beta-lactamase class C family)
VREAGRPEPVTLSTLFQAGSISKPVAATATMYYVQRGRLSLDENVNNRLVTWKVPENQFTANEKVTLRRIMSHTAGLTVHGFPGYAVDQPVPTMVQIFDGAKPANTAAIRVDLEPGARVRYSGGGTTVMQQLLVDVFRKPFPQLMKETVLARIGMENSTYENPLPPARMDLAASGHRRDGSVVKGKWHVYPEMAAAGLWTTPLDLAKYAIEIAKAWNGKSKLLSAETARLMLSPQRDQAALGFFIGETNPRQFGHGGADEGFQALLVAFADTGQGAALMANSDNGGRLMNLVAASVAREYEWKYSGPRPGAGEAMRALIDARGVDAAVAQYRELRRSRPDAYGYGEFQLNAVGYELVQAKRLPDALKVFELNVEMFPNAWNPWDSLAEAHMNLGHREQAIRAYEKSRQLNPKNENAAKILEKLKK